MKNTIFILSIFTSMHLYAQTSNDTINNQKLVELTQAGLGPDLIIDFLKTSPTVLDCGMSAILALKKENVSEKVISEMMHHCNQEKNLQIEMANSNNPLEWHQPGIYAFENDSLKKLYATVMTGVKAGGFGTALADSYTMGLSSSSVKSQLSGAEANLKCTPSTEFYFYFWESKDNFNNWWFNKASSPNEFSLISLSKKKNLREFRVGSSNAYTHKTGIDEDQKVLFTFVEVKKNIFKVTLNKPLEGGEYCFIYSATVPSSYSNDKVFDFSVPKQPKGNSRRK